MKVTLKIKHVENQYSAEERLVINKERLVINYKTQKKEISLLSEILPPSILIIFIHKS